MPRVQWPISHSIARNSSFLSKFRLLESPIEHIAHLNWRQNCMSPNACKPGPPGLYPIGPRRPRCTFGGAKFPQYTVGILGVSNVSTGISIVNINQQINLLVGVSNQSSAVITLGVSSSNLDRQVGLLGVSNVTTGTSIVNINQQVGNI